jgi:YHS domain-containing protein
MRYTQRGDFMNKVLRPLILVLSLVMLGCDAEAVKPPAAPGAVKSNCVVCGDHELDVTDQTLFTDYDGTRYYFCSDQCKADFAKEPAAYAAKQAARKSATMPASSPI